MPAAGLWMLAAVAVAMALTGLPAWVVLLGVSLAGSMVGIGAGAFDLSFVTGLPSRLVGLLENDLLQALPLVRADGRAAQPPAARRHPVSRRRGAARRARAPARRSPRSALGALLAPMNGSVGASVAMLSRTVHPPPAARRRAAGASAAALVVRRQHARRRGAAVAGADPARRRDAARAHRGGERDAPAVQIINTQDVFRGALVPAALSSLLVPRRRWWLGARRGASTRTRRRRETRARGGMRIADRSTLADHRALLGGVTLGYLYAVEAAATGGVVLFVYGVRDAHADARGRLRDGPARHDGDDRRAVRAARRRDDVHAGAPRIRHRPLDRRTSWRGVGRWP